MRGQEKVDPYQQALNYYSTGEYRAVISLFENLLSTSAGLEKAEIHCYLAASYREIGELSRAIHEWNSALSIYRKTGDKNLQPRLAALLVDLGQTYNSSGQFRQAIPLLEEAIELARKRGNKEIEAIALDVLGTSYSRAGELDRAIESYRKSLAIERGLNRPDSIATLLNNLVSALQNREARYLDRARAADLEGNDRETDRFKNLAEKDRSEALTTAKEALEASRPLKNLSTVRAMLNWMKLFPNEDYRSAALALLDRLPDSRRKAYDLIDLAEGMEGEKAIPLLERAIAVARNLNDPRTESFALGALGNVYEREKRYDLALDFTERARSAAGETLARDSLYRWQWQAGRIHRARGRIPEAKAAYRQAIASLESIRGDIAIAGQNYQLDFRDEVEPVYRGLLELLLDRGSAIEIEEAIRVFEGLQLSQLQNFFGDDCVEIREATRQPKEVLSRTKTAVIHSIILKEKTYFILRLPDGKIRSYPIAVSRERLQQNLLDWRLKLEDISNYQYLPLSRKLYDLLILPLEAELDAAKPDTVLFINDGLLRNVPMAAFYDGRKFLIEKYPVALSLGLNFLSEVRPSRNLRPLTFGLTIAIPPFNSLPNVERETRSLQKLLGGSRFIDRDFTRENIERQLPKKDHSIVHLATHGQFGGSLDSTFLQTFDGRLSLEKLENILGISGKKIELLTLSACQTAAGNDRATLGLAGVALRSGVKSTLGTLWSVNDAITVDLMEDFYRYLKEGTTKAEALRKAQLNQIARSGSHASMWSGFVLLGNWL
ncbi:CHAT domain-containing protein [Pannus brasiliensis CCIBt3594]|uniref:CHAT domain-containing protein n=1 Tax=Pannus brasiliensis CCIBt3594 TaxID=1427578 RepID=A0AAW9QW52_9CHRO